jgi:hypothetical protein
MERLSRSEIADAFALSEARGADLLVALAGANVWRGNLPAMRGDEPGSEERDDEQGETNPRALDTLLLARAIEILPPPCRSALATTYAKREDIRASQMIRDGGAEGTKVMECVERLHEIFSSLRTSDAMEQVPSWVFERENAPNGGHRSR